MEKAKTLVLVAHPHLADGSRVNARWARELQKYPERIEVRDVAAEIAANDGIIDADAWHEVLDAHDTIVFQFPVYWYSCPPVLRAWEDEVYTFGWAYGGARALPGELGRKVAGKKIAYAVSAGDVESHYGASGSVGFDMSQVLAPFYATANYLDATYVDAPWTLFGAEADLSDEELDRNAEGYAEWVLSL